MGNDITELQIRIAQLELENARLIDELQFLKTHSSISQGMRGETLVAQITNGVITSYAASFDVKTQSGIRIEIKYSKLNQPMLKSSTRRWNWSKPLGSMDRGKDYHFLLLIGEKDIRYSEDYPDTTPYVYFLVPLQDVLGVMDQGRSIGGMVQITSNLSKLRKKQNSPRLLGFQVSFDAIEQILGTAQIEAIEVVDN